MSTASRPTCPRSARRWVMGSRSPHWRGGARSWNAAGAHAEERVFLLSTTHGAESHALAAAREVMRIYVADGHLPAPRRAGRAAGRRAEAAATEAGVERRFVLLGHPSNLIYATLDETGARSQKRQATAWAPKFASTSLVAKIIRRAYRPG